MSNEENNGNGEGEEEIIDYDETEDVPEEEQEQEQNIEETEKQIIIHQHPYENEEGDMVYPFVNITANNALNHFPFAGDMILLMNKSASEIIPFAVNEDHTGSYYSGRGHRTLQLIDEGAPKVCYFDMKPLMGSGFLFNLKWFIMSIVMKLLQLRYMFSFIFNLYGAQSV